MTFRDWLREWRNPQPSPEVRALLARQTNLLRRDEIRTAAEQRRAGRLAEERRSNNFVTRIEMHFRGEL